MSDDIASLKKVAARWLPAFQQDIKDFLRVVGDDPELDDDLREKAIGVVLYCLAPGDVIPDFVGVVGYLDDALALRIGLAEIRDKAPERFAVYRDRLPELTELLGQDLDAFRAVLGELYTAFEQRIAATVTIEFKGKRAKSLMADDEGAAWLQDEVSEKALQLDFKASSVDSAVRQVDDIVKLFRTRLGNKR